MGAPRVGGERGQVYERAWEVWRTSPLTVTPLHSVLCFHLTLKSNPARHACVVTAARARRGLSAGAPTIRAVEGICTNTGKAVVADTPAGITRVHKDCVLEAGGHPALSGGWMMRGERDDLCVSSACAVRRATCPRCPRMTDGVGVSKVLRGALGGTQ